MGFRKFVLTAALVSLVGIITIVGLAMYEMRHEKDAAATTLHCTEYEHVLTDESGNPVWCSPNRATP